MRILVPSLWVLFSVFVLVSTALPLHEGWINSDVSTTVDLTSHIVKVSNVIVATNKGSKAASVYHAALPASLAPSVSHLRLTDQSGTQLVPAEKPEQVTRGGVAWNLYPYTLAKPVEAGKSVNLTFLHVYTHISEPSPAEIAQGESQLVITKSSAFYPTAYATATQVTNVNTPSSRVESFTEEPPKVVRRGDVVTYGPYQDVPAFSVSPVSIHYENNKAFTTVRKLVREIEISMWGNLAVEEHYEIRHTGAKYAGHFARADYQRAPQSVPAAIRNFKQTLPATAVDIYYRDDIGNISSSHVLQQPRHVDLELIPRFPLLGGWKTLFYIGYNQPLSSNLTTTSSGYLLNVSALPQFPEAVFDEVEIRVILPERASNVEVFSTVPRENEKRETQWTYLDTTGRTVVSFTLSNIVSENNSFFQVSFSWSSIFLFREPFMLIAAFFAFFVFVMVLVRMDFTISKNEPAAAAAAAAAAKKQN